MDNIKNYEDLQISDAFMFVKVMRNSEICKQLLEEILHIKIKHIVYIEGEKNMEMSNNYKSIRLDVYVEDSDNTVYNLEMQVRNTGNIPRRARYYQGIIDLNLIEKGQDYDTLNISYIIFICRFDLFGYNRYIYTFENRCKEVEDLSLDDGSTKIFLNTKGSVGDISQELKNLLSYFDGNSAKGSLALNIDEEVHKVRNNVQWRREYMTLEMEYREKFREGRKEGRKEGRRELLSIIQYLNQDHSPAEASQKFNLPIEEINDIVHAIRS